MLSGKQCPLILDIKRNSLDDGPGVRSVVMFKGCPLDCVWCHNPESKRLEPELAFRGEACIRCNQCQDCCPEGAIIASPKCHIDRTACQLCFTCAEGCPAGALRRIGLPLSVDEVLDELQKDLTFFRNSGGGVTLSGGEPTVSQAFCHELLQGCRELGISAILETCGQFAPTPFFEEIHPYLDEVYVDVKLIDAEQHRRYCGVENRRILDNVRRLVVEEKAGGAAVLPRVPLVPGITATDSNLRAIAAFLRQLGVEHVSLLPYNPTWNEKARSIGAPEPPGRASFMSDAQLEHCRSFFADFEVV